MTVSDLAHHVGDGLHHGFANLANHTPSLSDAVNRTPDVVHSLLGQVNDSVPGVVEYLEDVDALEQYAPYTIILVGICLLYCMRRPCLRCCCGDDELANTDLSDILNWFFCKCCGCDFCRGWTQPLARAVGLAHHSIYLDDIVLGDLPESLAESSIYLVVRQGTHRHKSRSQKVEVADCDMVEFPRVVEAHVRDGPFDDKVELAVCKYSRFFGGSRDICSVAVPAIAFVNWKKERVPPVKLALQLTPQFADSRRQPFVYMHVGDRNYRPLPQLTEEIVTSRSMCWSSAAGDIDQEKLRRIQRREVVLGSIGRSAGGKAMRKRKRCLNCLLSCNRYILVLMMIPALFHVYNSVCHEHYEFLTIMDKWEGVKLPNSTPQENISDLEILEECNRYRDPILQYAWEYVHHSKTLLSVPTDEVHKACTPSRAEVKATCRDKTRETQKVFFELVPCVSCNGYKEVWLSPWTWLTVALILVYVYAIRQCGHSVAYADWKVPKDVRAGFEADDFHRNDLEAERDDFEGDEGYFE
eukprot:CAMPEP_0115215136 /NCGR_PEP_ID=MMETSP0270-20121206/24659_1 /TAXON_ID=71861 /ORGANISM="Scrippsiella trochoidea, Strain CCMP3099" /LENGTH=525 /DNA_ID=CAMNT_0002628917 /DNA_START=22 /DNA_END=1599 /DNA_ORIENTATION=+